MPNTPITVLLLDDSPEDRAMFYRYLSRDTDMHYTILQADNAEDALHLVDEHNPECVLLDYYLPDGTGLEVLAELHQRHGSTARAVVMLTGSGSERTAVEAMKLGAQDYLVKDSVTPTMLRHAIHNAISKVQLQLQIEQQRAHIMRREREFTTLIEQAPDVILRFDTAFRHIYVNRRAAAITGHSADFFLNKTHREVGAPRQLAELWETNLGAVFASGQSTTMTYEKMTVDGMRSFQAALALDNAEEPPTVIAIVRDITEQRQAEQRLELLVDASSVLGSLVTYEETLPPVADLLVNAFADVCAISLLGPDNVLEHVAVAARNGDVSAAHAIVERWYEQDAAASAGPRQVLASGIAEFWCHAGNDAWPAPPYTPDQHALLEQLHLSSVITVPLVTAEHVFGALFIALVARSGCLAYDDSVLAQEVARRVSLSIEHARLYREAQEGIYEREAFLSIASHELRNPLTTLLGRAQLLVRRSAKNESLSDRDKRDLDIVVSQANRVNAMLNELLDVSRIGTGQFFVEREALDLSALLQRIVQDLQPTLVQHQLHLAGSAACAVNGDPMRLEQVFRNLLTNAVKYSPDGGDIAITMRQDSDAVCVGVTDHGVGIPDTALPHLFQRFYRVPGSSRHATGSGIGLYVVKEIVQRHGGNITVTSELGQGSTFEVCLPCAA